MAKGYIKRETLVEKICQRMNNGSIRSWLCGIVNDIPAAEVAPVVHGRWISDEGDILFHCSKCETQISTDWDYDDLQWNYCPECGAKMDGGK